jgi:hypothetical protein
MGRPNGARGGKHGRNGRGVGGVSNSSGRVRENARGKKKGAMERGQAGEGVQRQSTAFNDAFFRSKKKASAYRTDSKAQPPDMSENLKDLYRNITIEALKVCFDHFFYRVVKARSLCPSSSTRYCIVLLFGR